MRRLVVPVLALLLVACSGDGALPTHWSRVYADPALDGELSQQMRAVVSTERGLVAVGMDEAGGDVDAAVWISSDGTSWERIPPDEATFGGPDAEWLWDVTNAADGLVAVGFGGPGERQLAAVWTSPDGETWQRVPHATLVFGDDRGAVMLGVASGPGAVVAVGFSGWEDGDAAAWFSPDGATWARVPHDDTRFGGAGRQGMWAVVWSGDRFVAVGEDDGSGAIWTSTDGTSWERVADPEGVLDTGIGATVLVDVTTGGPGLVAVGNGWAIDRPAVVVWTSSDGARWTRVPHDEAVFGGLNQPVVTAVAAGPGGVIATGFDATTGSGDIVLWSSRDGMAWSRIDTAGLAAPHGQYPAAVAFYDGRVFVVGSEVTLVSAGVTDGRAAVWVGE